MPSYSISWAAVELVRSMFHFTGELSSKVAHPLQAVAGEQPRLMELNVSYCYELTSRGLACLSSLTNLRALKLTECHKLDEKGRLFPGTGHVASGVFSLHDHIPCICLDVTQLWELVSLVQGLTVSILSCSSLLSLLSPLWMLEQHSQGVDT